MTEPIALTLDQAGALVGRTARHLRDEWRAGRLSLIDVGTKSRPAYRVRPSELRRWFDAHPAAEPKGRTA